MASSLSTRKTKIVATIGPSSWDEKTLTSMVQAGLNIARLNFSHGEFAEHERCVKLLRKISETHAAPIGILQDLQGPKIRLLGFTGERLVQPGETLVLSDRANIGTGKLCVDLDNLSQYVHKGQSIFIDDGIIELRVEKVKGADITCQVLHGGTLRPRKGVNLPDADLPIASMTDKDLKDLKKGVSLGFDYVALSFVRTREDLIKLKALLKKWGSTARVIAKIEKKQAIDNIEDIVEEADGIMVARGDLSVEIGQVHLPTVQKRIIQICNRKGKPVITATQMLDSMQVNSRPTRAEITDVANAVLDGSDALMLSGESAFGKYPVRSIETMHEIIREVEKQPQIYHQFKHRRSAEISVPESIAISAVLCAKQLQADAIVCLSTTGKTAQMISKYRPRAKLIAVTAKSEALCKLELVWGVQTLKVPQYSNTEDAISKIEKVLLEHNIINPGAHVVLTLGLPVAQGQTTNAVRVFVAGKGSQKKSESKRPLRFIPI